MKKLYIKPEMLIENFLLSERIANCTSTDPAFTTGCDVVIDEEALAGFKALGYPNLFSTICKEQVTGGVDINLDGTVDLCYHTSTGSSLGYDNIFSS